MNQVGLCLSKAFSMSLTGTASTIRHFRLQCHNVRSLLLTVRLKNDGPINICCPSKCGNKFTTIRCLERLPDNAHASSCRMGKGREPYNRSSAYHDDSAICIESESLNVPHGTTCGEEIDIEDFTVDEPDIAEFPGMDGDVAMDYRSREKLPRGADGVFDLIDLVTLLRENNVLDICALRVPGHLHYVDHIVIGTCRSPRQLRAVAEIVRVVYKRRRDSGDPKSVRVEGADTDSWIAMDLGNIALHLFLADTREMYDLESLWSLGEEYDDQCRMSTSTDSYGYDVLGLDPQSSDAASGAASGAASDASSDAASESVDRSLDTTIL